MGQKEASPNAQPNQSVTEGQAPENNSDEKDLHMIEVLKKENDILKKQLESLNKSNKYRNFSIKYFVSYWIFLWVNTIIFDKVSFEIFFLKKLLFSHFEILKFIIVFRIGFNISKLIIDKSMFEDIDSIKE